MDGFNLRPPSPQDPQAHTHTSKKRKPKFQRNPKTKEEIQLIRTVKCSLGKILRSTDVPGEDNVLGSNLENILCSLNQLKVLASLVVKHHLYSLWEGQSSSTSSRQALPFQLNQTYFTRVFALLQDEKSQFRTKPIYETDLKRSVKVVLQQVQPKMVHCGLTKTTMTTLLSYVSRTMVTNFQVHIHTRFEQVLVCWLKNQFRSLMNDNEVEDQRKSLRLYFEAFDTAPADFAFFSSYSFYKQQWDDLQKAKEDYEEDDESFSLKIPYNVYLQSMYQMMKDSEDLEEQCPSRPMKSISVFPQFDMKMGSILFDTRAVTLLNAQLQPNSSPPDEKEEEDGGEEEDDTDQKQNLENDDISRARLIAERTWNHFFDLKAIQKLRPHWKFGWSITTNGVSVSVKMVKNIPKPVKSPLRKKSKKSLTPLPELKNGFHAEKTILESYTGHADLDLKTAQWFSIDPGISNIITAWNINDSQPSMMLKQGQYRHESGLNQVRQKTKPSAPLLYQKSVSLSRLNVYMGCIRQAWPQKWPLSKKTRRWEFFRWIKRQSFLDKTVARMEKEFKVVDKPTILLFGNAGQHGGFGKIKGGGIKGPVLTLKRLLAQKFPLINVSEFRTSKLCSECGRSLLHPKNNSIQGVSFCSHTNHHHMMNRDRDAARKIGYRFLCQLKGLSLGPFDRSVPSEHLGLVEYNLLKTLDSDSGWQPGAPVSNCRS